MERINLKYPLILIGYMKLISWNVNGIRAILKKDHFEEELEKEKPDVLCFQETKAHPDQMNRFFLQYPNHYWNAAEKKGYSGTTTFSKIKPLQVSYGIEKKEHDTEGRVITIEFEKFYLVNCYTPNSGRGNGILDYRQKWDIDFLDYLKRLDKKKPVIICGDLNVAHTDIDLEHPKANYNKSPGYMQEEIDGFENILKSGFVDTFRQFYPDKKKEYTWWSYRSAARQRNVGWRIDYILISERFVKSVKEAFILQKMKGSDHCPVGIVVKT